jgi:hypothetical protein
LDRKTLILGAVLGFVVGIAANVLSFALIEFECVTCTVSYGVPFQIAVMRGFHSSQQVFWGGVLADLLIFVAAGSLAAAAVKMFPGKRRALSWEKPEPPRQP